MNRKLLFSALLCWSMVALLSATTVSIKEFNITGSTPNAYLDNSTDREHQNSVCMGINDTLTVSMDDDFFSGLDYHRWTTAGSIAIVDTLNASTIRVVSNGYGKGRVYLRYIANDCNTYTYFDIFKSFSAANFEISGPDCMAPGDVVVLSVQPLLTEHLSDQIGIDRYYWNVTATPKPSFVDRIVYAAGDGSAVTFVAGNVSDSDTVTVNFGVCNQATDRAARQKLGKTAPKPEVPEEVCAEYGVRSITLSVSNPVEGVEYSWWCKNAKWQFNRTIGTSVAVTLDAESAEDIIVTASYIDGSGCSGTETAIKVNRSWGADVALTSPNSTSYRFTTDSTYEFKLTGQLSSGSIEWLCPQGWSIAPASSQGYANIKLIPGTGALLQDTLRARTHSCSESGYDMVEHLVYVRPAPVAAISGETCLTAGQQYVFRVAAEGNGPKADSYTWKINNNTAAYAAFTGDSLVFTATDGMTSIAVRPNGLNGCNGDFYTENLLFKPTAPTSIVMTEPVCLVANMLDTITLELEGIQQNQDYNWILPTGWTLIEASTHNTEIQVQTNGVIGNYTISAYGIGQGICGNSNLTSFNVSIDSVPFTLSHELSGRTSRLVYFDPYPLEDAVYYTWFVNGTLTAEGTDALEITFSRNIAASVMLIVEFENGCQQIASIEIPAYTSGASYAPNAAMINEFANAEQENSNMLESSNTILTLSPNPANTVLTLTMSALGQHNVLRIYSMNGKLIYSQMVTDTYVEIPTRRLPAGTYMLRLIQDGRAYSEQFIVKH